MSLRSNAIKLPYVDSNSKLTKSPSGKLVCVLQEPIEPFDGATTQLLALGRERGGVATWFAMDPPCEELVIFLVVLLKIIELAHGNAKMFSVMVCLEDTRFGSKDRDDQDLEIGKLVTIRYIDARDSYGEGCKIMPAQEAPGL